jgi:hypothetical protein
MKRSKLVLGIVVAVVLLAAYPAFVLGYTWSHVARAKLPGGRNGPLDAYRHTLASAVVAYSLSPRAVEWTSRVMERGGTPSNSMDRHNNRIGVGIGVRARSFGEIEPSVRGMVKSGTVDAPGPDQVTWLPPKHWHRATMW